MSGEWDFDICRHERCLIPGVHPAHTVEERRGRPRKYDPMLPAMERPSTVIVSSGPGRRRSPRGTREITDELGSVKVKPSTAGKLMIFCPSCDGRNRSCETCVGRGEIGYMHWLYRLSLQGRKNG